MLSERSSSRVIVSGPTCRDSEVILVGRAEDVDERGFVGSSVSALIGLLIAAFRASRSRVAIALICKLDPTLSKLEAN